VKHMLSRRRVVLGVLAALLAIAGLGVVWPRDGDARAGREALARAEQAARSGRSITAAELTDMPFSRLVVVRGTAGAEEIRLTVGTDWGRAGELAFHCCDPAPLWVFVNDDEVVAFFRASSEMGYGDGVALRSYRPSELLSLSAPSSGDG
jgi:hypothetical protein